MLKLATQLWASIQCWFDQHLSTVADWLSIIGALISIITLLRLQSLKSALRDNALKRPQHDLFRHVRESLVGKPRLTTSHERGIRSLLAQVRDRNCSWMPFRSRLIKRKLTQIEEDVKSKPKPDVIVAKLDELRVLIDNTAAP